MSSGLSVPWLPFPETGSTWVPWSGRIHRWVQIFLPPFGWVPVDTIWDDSSQTLRYFGWTNNWSVMTNIGGGPSNYLGWKHLSRDVSSGDIDVISKVAKWSVRELIEENEETAR